MLISFYANPDHLNLFFVLKTVAEETEIIILRRERDELQSLLDKFERHLAEVRILKHSMSFTDPRDSDNTQHLTSVVYSYK